ncbi:MAG: M14 family zinc carboxypeptidase [Thermoanaerobaculia bacterium]
MEISVRNLSARALLLTLLLLAPSAVVGALNLADDPFAGAGPWMVSAWFGTDDTIREVASWGDHFQTDRKLGFLRILADPERLEQLRALGFYVEVDAPSTALIRQAEEANRQAAEALARGETPAAGIPNFPCYRTVEETFATAQAIVAAHPTLASWIDAGDSWDKLTAGGPAGYDMMVLKLTNSAVPGPKPILFATSAIHAREYTTAELMTRFAEQLVSGYGADADATWLLDFHEIHLMLQTNPDGRKQAEAAQLWRKNTNQNYCGATSTSRGADLNRNFSFQWNCCGGSSASACSDTYHGPSAASEPEVQAVQNYLRAIFPDQRAATYPGGAAPADATGIYLDVHSYSDLVLWPWGGTNTPTDNAAALTTLGRRFAWFTGYRPEQAIGLYPTDGTTDDFAYGDLGVAAFTFELGNDFFEACSSFESTVLPTNLGALLYAAKVARTPYMTPTGPDTLALSITPGAVAPGDPAVLHVTLDDSRFSNANGTEPVEAITAGEVYIDLAPWQPGAVAIPLTAEDGFFNSTIEAASATLDTTALASGRHILYVRGEDAGADWGPVSALFLYVVDPATAPFVQGVVRDANTLAPLAATVSVGPFSTTTAAGTGAYSFQVPPGTYDIRASSAGHAPRSVAGVIAAEFATVTADFALPPFAPVLVDDGEGTNPGWTAQSPWALTTETAASPTHSWSDSPGGNYANNRDTSLTSPVLDLTLATDPAIEWKQIYDLENGYDYGHIEISIDGGATWTEVASYNGEGHTAIWESAHLALPGLAGSALAKVRFRLTSDISLTFDGWHLDDIALTAVFPPPTGLFADGFESGNLSLWTSAVP